MEPDQYLQTRHVNKSIKPKQTSPISLIVSILGALLGLMLGIFVVRYMEMQDLLSQFCLVGSGLLLGQLTGAAISAVIVKKLSRSGRSE